MFNGDFNHHIERILSSSLKCSNWISFCIDFDPISSSLFGFYDEYLDRSYYESDQEKTRIVWVTNYSNNDDCTYLSPSRRMKSNVFFSFLVPIYVPIEDPLLQLDHTSSNANEKDEAFLSNDLSKLNLDDLLLLLYQLQQKTTRNSVMLSNSAISSSSSDSMGLY